MSYDVQEFAVEPLVDGMIDLLKINLVAKTELTQDAHTGDTVLHVNNSVRFKKFDYILLMDNRASVVPISGELQGVEFHKVSKNFQETGLLYLAEPLQSDFLVSQNGRIQKSIKKAALYEKDILYGDRQVINFDYVAICVEPNTTEQDWLAVRLLGATTNLSIMVYVKCGGAGDQEEYAMRVCNAYADSIKSLLNGNIHLDIGIDEAALVRDAHAGDTGVYIDCDIAENWTPDLECLEYEVQDNTGANQLLKVVNIESSSSSSLSVSSSTQGQETSSSTSSISTESSASSQQSSRTSVSSESSESWSSQSITYPDSTSVTSTSSSISSISSDSSPGGTACFITLNRPLTRDFLIKDKAVIRRKKRFTYDSRITSAEYGSTQKGSVLMKVAKLSWFGKEAEAFQFPQVGIGRQS